MALTEQRVALDPAHMQRRPVVWIEATIASSHLHLGGTSGRSEGWSTIVGPCVSPYCATGYTGRVSGPYPPRAGLRLRRALR